MAADHLAYLRALARAGYEVTRLGSGHMGISWNGTRVATGSATGWKGRGLRNLKGHVKNFERNGGRS